MMAMLTRQKLRQTDLDTCGIEIPPPGFWPAAAAPAADPGRTTGKRLPWSQWQPCVLERPPPRARGSGVALTVQRISTQLYICMKAPLKQVMKLQLPLLGHATAHSACFKWTDSARKSLTAVTRSKCLSPELSKGAVQIGLHSQKGRSRPAVRLHAAASWH